MKAKTVTKDSYYEVIGINHKLELLFDAKEGWRKMMVTFGKRLQGGSKHFGGEKEYFPFWLN